MPMYTLDIPVKTNTRVFFFNSVFLLTKSVMLMTVHDSQTFVLTLMGDFKGIPLHQVW